VVREAGSGVSFNPQQVHPCSIFWITLESKKQAIFWMEGQEKDT